MRSTLRQRRGWWAWNLGRRSGSDPALRDFKRLYRLGSVGRQKSCPLAGLGIMLISAGITCKIKGMATIHNTSCI